MQVDELEARMNRVVRQRLVFVRSQVQQQAARLESLSPLGVLSRGYSLTQTLANGRIVREAAELQTGDVIVTRFGKGKAVSRVESVER